jgi:GTP-binding protein
MAIDTAGVRKKKSLEHAIELFAHSRSNDSIRRAHVCVHMFDVREPISQVDKSLAAYCVEQHKPVLIVGNKIDLAPEFDLKKWDAYIKQQLPAWTTRRSRSSRLGRAPTCRRPSASCSSCGSKRASRCRRRELNEVLQAARDRLMPSSGGHYPKLFYGTQIGTEPLSVMVFVNEPRLFRGQYERYLTQRAARSLRLPRGADAPRVPPPREGRARSA